MSRIVDWRASLSGEDTDVVEFCCAYARRDCASESGLAESSEIWRSEISRTALGRSLAQAVRPTKPSQLKLGDRVGNLETILVDLQSLDFRLQGRSGNAQPGGCARRAKNSSPRFG